MRGSSTGQTCCHCGTNTTPCWRKGPPEKPTLCNACGSRYLVKGSLAGYFPGARRATSSRGQDSIVVVAKGPRKAAAPAAGPKRKSQDYDRAEAPKAPRVFSDYEAMEELRYSLFLGGAKPTIVNRWAAQKTLSDSSADVHEEECFKDAQYLDASSDEYQDASHDDAPSMLQSLRATVVAADFSSQPASFQRRPRKQLKPVACSC